MAKAKKKVSKKKTAKKVIHIDGQQEETKIYKFRVPLKDVDYKVWSKNGKSKISLIEMNIKKHYPAVNLPLTGNPRVTVRPNAMTKKIVTSTLNVNTYQFSERSHPVCWVGKTRKVGKFLEITVISVIDGGRRHKACVDAKIAGTLMPHHNVRIWLYENYTPKQTVAISASLNDSGSLKVEALANLRGAFDYFKKIFPDQTDKKTINFGRESTAGAYPIGELVSLLMVGDPNSTYAMNTISTDNKTKLDAFERVRMEKLSLWPEETVQFLGNVVDYCHLYVAEAFTHSDSDRVKTKKKLIFIDKTISKRVRRKEEYLSYVVSIMRLMLVKKKGRLHWDKKIKKDPETFIRNVVNRTGMTYIKDILKNARNNRFQTDEASWQTLFKAIRKVARK